MAGWNWGTGHAVAELELQNRILTEEVKRLSKKVEDAERQAEDWQRRYLLGQRQEGAVVAMGGTRLGSYNPATGMIEELPQ